MLAEAGAWSYLARNATWCLWLHALSRIFAVDLYSDNDTQNSRPWNACEFIQQSRLRGGWIFMISQMNHLKMIIINTVLQLS